MFLVSSFNLEQWYLNVISEEVLIKDSYGGQFYWSRCYWGCLSTEQKMKLFYTSKKSMMGEDTDMKTALATKILSHDTEHNNITS